jgi:ribosomal protein S12 methylthiotransferase accessory factor
MILFGRKETARKNYRDGTHRSRSPQETLDAYLPLMDRCGVTRLANVTGLDHVGIPVYVAVRPLSRCLSVSQGKGLDAASAKASALMEALEYWHGENIELGLRYESMHALERSSSVLGRDAISAKADEPLDPNRPLLWVEGWDFFNERPIWVPFDFVHTNFVDPAVQSRRLCKQDGNGLASGNCLLEASVHALCELIERDSTSLWFLDPREGSDARSQVDLDTVDPINHELVARIHAADLLVGAYDATSDTGIPSYQAVVFDQPGCVRAMGYFWGFGCHLSPEVALARALTEAVQCRLTEITGSREDILPDDYLLNRDDNELAEMKKALCSSPPQRSLRDRPSLATDTFEGDFEVLRNALRLVGITEGALVNLSRPEIGLPVVKAVVPELEGWFRGGLTDRALAPARCGRFLQKVRRSDPLRFSRSFSSARDREALSAAGRVSSAGSCWRRSCRPRARVHDHRHHRRALRTGRNRLAQGDPLRALARGVGVRRGQHGSPPRSGASSIRNGRNRGDLRSVPIR